MRGYTGTHTLGHTTPIPDIQQSPFNETTMTNSWVNRGPATTTPHNANNSTTKPNVEIIGEAAVPAQFVNANSSNHTDPSSNEEDDDIVSTTNVSVSQFSHTSVDRDIFSVDSSDIVCEDEVNQEEIQTLVNQALLNRRTIDWNKFTPQMYRHFLRVTGWRRKSVCNNEQLGCLGTLQQEAAKGNIGYLKVIAYLAKCKIMCEKRGYPLSDNDEFLNDIDNGFSSEEEMEESKKNLQVSYYDYTRINSNNWQTVYQHRTPPDPWDQLIACGHFFIGKVYADDVWEGETGNGKRTYKCVSVHSKSATFQETDVPFPCDITFKTLKNFKFKLASRAVLGPKVNELPLGSVIGDRDKKYVLQLHSRDKDAATYAFDIWNKYDIDKGEMTEEKMIQGVLEDHRALQIPRHCRDHRIIDKCKRQARVPSFSYFNMLCYSFDVLRHNP